MKNQLGRNSEVPNKLSDAFAEKFATVLVNLKKLLNLNVFCSQLTNERYRTKISHGPVN